MEPELFLVASPRRWVADDFAVPARRRHLTVLHSFGLDLPWVDASRFAGLWTPAAHASRLRRARWTLPLSATGPLWLGELGERWTKRRIWAGQLEDLGDCPFRAGYAKVAEAKVPELPAAWYEDLGVFARIARAVIPPDSFVQVANARLAIELEVRCFVADSAVVAAAPYLYEGVSDLSPITLRTLAPATAAARSFAEDVVQATSGPSGYVLDIARLEDGSHAVLETNPAWCSGPYSADPDGVVHAVIASCNETSSSWAWEPDAVLAQHAEHKPLLTTGGDLRVLDDAQCWRVYAPS